VGGPQIDPRLEEAIQLQEEEDQHREKAAREKRIRQCYVITFTSPEGREVLKDLRNQFYDVSTYVPGDPYGTHVAEGGRQVLLRILTLLAEEAEGPKEKQQESAET
jgi:hypothetical protein